MKAPSSILIIRYSALGDVVLATSVLDPLRTRFPEARLEWVTDEQYVPILEKLPQLAAVHGLRRGDCAGKRDLLRRLRGRFDLSIDLQHKVRSILLARTAAPIRITYRQRSLGRAVLSLVGFDPPVIRAHATALYAEALRPLGITNPGALHLGPSEWAWTAAAEALKRVRPPVVALAPGGRWATKRWPTERFAAVADALADRGMSLVLIGGPADREILNAFRGAVQTTAIADFSSLPIDILAATLAQVQLLVTNDSGPSHLANAMGTPALVLFGPTSVVRWGPPVPGRALTLDLPCSPCTNHGSQRCPEKHRRCLLDLPVERVVAEVLEMLSR